MFMNKPVILCVDDERFILSSLGEQLSRHLGQDYDIELIDDATEVLDILTELTLEGIDVPLLISDQMMPKLTGDKLLVQVHAQYPQTLKMLLTGYSSTEAIAHVVNSAELYRYLSKPWDETDLILTVRQALRRYEQDSQLAQQHAALYKANDALERSNAVLQATLESTADGILVTNRDGKLVNFNQRLLSLWGLSADELRGLGHLSSIIHALDPSAAATDQLFAVLDEARDRESKGLLELRDGRTLEYYSCPQRLNQTILGSVWSFQDITQQKQAEATIQRQAYFDDLTDLPNRSFFNQQLDKFLQEIQATGQGKLAVLFLDLDRFKNINDALGHPVGDRLLQLAVQRMKGILRPQDIIARWGGDEFTLLIPHIKDRDDAAVVARRLLDSMQEPFETDGKLLKATVSIGIAVYPEDGQDSEILVRNADAALYRVKELGRNDFQHYSISIHSQTNERLVIEGGLHRALIQQEFMVYYQPQIDVKTGEVVQMEALVRWQHPSLGMIPPNAFIPLAEQNGFIIPLGKWVLKTACQQLHQWQGMGLSELTMGVNLSAKQLRDKDLVTDVKQIVEEAQIAYQALELEITETAAMENMDITQSILSCFQDMGINLALDDFGTGYSSLGYLKRLPFHTLKIDQSFVRDLITHSKDVAIVNAIISLASGLELRVIAEGVETEDLKNLLLSLDCYMMQGYLFSKPLPPEEATKLLQKAKQRSLSQHP
jgi:diguanylate cyclase (GGDEF)-like protein/PAS domain S-box-containing protein